MLNLESKSDIQKLADSASSSFKKLDTFRKNRVSAIKEYVGTHYSDNGSQEKTPINLIELAINIYVQNLVATNPKTLVNTPYQGQHIGQADFRPQAKNLELGLDRLLDEIKFANAMQDIVKNALFGMGIAKRGLETGKEIEISGYIYDIGQPFIDSVSLDNWVHDMDATSLYKCKYMGDRYPVPLWYLRDNPDIYDPDVVEKMDSDKRNEPGEKDSDLTGKSNVGEDDSIEEEVWLWDLWLPRQNKIVTIPAFEDASQALRVVEWYGPEVGPYKLLSFNSVPGNLLPLPPVSLWRDLNSIVNKLFTKLSDQSIRQKTILGIGAGNEEDGQKIDEAEDGDTVPLNNPGQHQEFSFHGIDQSNLAYAIQLKNLFTYVAGNLDTLGGLSPQSDTVGQDRLLDKNASKRMSHMQDATHEFTVDNIKCLGWYLFSDPLIELPITKRVEGTDIAISSYYRSEDMEGDFYDYNFDIQAYSMQKLSPSERLQVIRQVFGEFVGPYAQMLQQQGIQIDFSKLYSLIGKYTNVPELGQIFKASSVPTEYQPGPVGEKPGQGGQQSNQTTRRYERVNRPGASQQGQEEALIQNLLGSRMQKSQEKSMNRQVS